MVLRTARPMKVTRRELRLASGLILFAYVATHLANHALGLVSVDAAEHGLDLALVLWQSLPGTLLLYGAAAVHLALAFDAIYRRRTLRMPPVELLRIALGLGIPLLLIGHAVATRLAWQLYDQTPHYRRVVWALWSSDGEGRQLALLVPGWLHGCLGLHFAYGRRRGYQLLRPALFAAAILLPVLGGLGFLSMGKELAADLAQRPRLDALLTLHPDARLALGRARDGLLGLYFSCIAAVFAARELRALYERRRSTLVRIRYPQREVQVPRGWSVLDASRSHHLPHLSACGGRGRCSTCRVRVTGGDEHCPPPGAAEASTLSRIHAGPGVRLACQLRPHGPIAVTPLLAAPRSLLGPVTEAPAQEREVALVAAVWRRREAFVASLLPQDQVFISRLFGETVGAAARAAGGTEIDPAPDRCLFVFGLESEPAAAARQALAAAQRVERALDDLRRRIAREFGAAPSFVLLLDGGPAVLGDVGFLDSRRLAAAGPVVDRLGLLREASLRDEAGLWVGSALLDAAGVAVAAHAERVVPGRDGQDVRVAMPGSVQELMA